MQAVVTCVRGVCMSVSESVCLSRSGGACSVRRVRGVIRCSLCQITLATC